MNKKGNINQLFPAVLALILIGALLFAGITILSSIQDMTYLNTAAVSSNETLAQATTAGITLATGSAARTGVCGTLTNVVNGTGLVRIGVGNFTQTGANKCTVTNATSTVDLADYTANLKYSYPYTYDAVTTTTTSVGAVNTSMGTLATTWLPIIVVVIAAGIVLGILLGAFGRKQK